MKHAFIAAVCVVLTLAACEKDDRTGLPENDTTGTTQAVSETTTASATTTGVTGGTSSDMASEDKEFVVDAGMGGLAEVTTGNLALQRAVSADVKAFAQRMVTDHTKANQELREFATTKGLALPTELEGPVEIAHEHLKTLQGADFDRAYMQHMIDDHRKDVAEFEKAATSSADPDLRAWAARTLPTLQEHLALAHQVAAKMKN